MRKSNFDKFPTISSHGHCIVGWEPIVQVITDMLLTGDSKKVLAIECYQGVDTAEIRNAFKSLKGLSIVETGQALLEAKRIEAMLEGYVTDDPVFGYICPLDLAAFFDTEKLASIRAHIDSITEGIVLVIGTGTALITPAPDMLVYADMPRWEIQRRFRANKTGNLGAENPEDAFAYKYKRAYYVDWRVLDRLKKRLMDCWSFVLDTTIPNSPKMVSGSDMEKAMEATTNQPFRVVPFFDPGPWGGQWLKDVCDLDRSAPNYAWGFDCVPEENSLLYDFDGVTFEIPAINLVYRYPAYILGQKTYEAFGDEFPIRFDFLDTMQGGNLSLQVHPLDAYAKEKFGIPYTQNESYYFLDASDDAFVYLGLKENIQPQSMIADLQMAQITGKTFDADQYVQKWPAKKHGHVLIPAGTIHCSAANTVVLEISATPFNFTFKLWDWQRLGLDGKPRPISLEHGKANIQWDRTTAWTDDHLVDRFEPVAKGDGWLEERTGLDEESFIETRRHWFSKMVSHHTSGVLNIVNLVEGEEAIIESPSYAFQPFILHYVETVIIPAAVGSYTIRPYGSSEGTQIGTIKASIRTDKIGNYKYNP